jgi:hypothetical protein
MSTPVAFRAILILSAREDMLECAQQDPQYCCRKEKRQRKKKWLSILPLDAVEKIAGDLRECVD